MTNSIQKLTTLAALAVTLVTLSGNVFADTKFQQNHPRRAQVNARLNNQNQRIDTEVKDGQISRKQGAALHNDDHQIRTEERDMASQNNTHITTQEQATLNQQENGVSKLIGR
jgi:membrane-bound lytic murein transglycosylase B